MEQRVIDKMNESIKTILDSGLNTNNIDNLLKLSKIKHMAKEDLEMNYGNDYRYYQGRNVGYDSYGENYRGYGARGYDRRYRGHEHLDRMSENYGRYEQDRERYGTSEDTKRSLKVMLQSMEDFARMLREEAQSQEEVEMIRQTAQRIAQM